MEMVDEELYKKALEKAEERRKEMLIWHTLKICPKCGTKLKEALFGGYYCSKC